MKDILGKEIRQEDREARKAERKKAKAEKDAQKGASNIARDIQRAYKSPENVAKREFDAIEESPTYDYDKRRKEINESVGSSLSDKNKARLEAESKLDTRPSYIQADKPSLEEATELARRQKRAKISDALIAFNKGYHGQTYDKKDWGQTKLREEREALYTPYKDAAVKNKAAYSKWEDSYNKKILSLLDQQSKDETKSEAEKQAAKTKMAEIKETNKGRIALESAKAANKVTESKYKPSRTISVKGDDGEWLLASKNSYSELYNRLYSGDLGLMNQIANKLGYPVGGIDGGKLTPQQKEEVSRYIIEQNYDLSEDDEKGLIATKKEGLPDYGRLVKSEESLSKAQARVEKAQAAYDDASNRRRSNPESEVSIEKDAALKALSNAQDAYDSLSPTKQKNKSKGEQASSTLDKYL